MDSISEKNEEESESESEIEDQSESASEWEQNSVYKNAEIDINDIEIREE